jgi:hypothetical protein
MEWGEVSKETFDAVADQEGIQRRLDVAAATTKGCHVQQKHIGSVHPALTIVCIAQICAAYPLAWLFIGERGLIADGRWAAAIALSGIVAMDCLLLTSRVFVDCSGSVHLVNFAIERSVPAHAIQRVSSSRGLKLELISGDSLGSVAYGSSLWGNIFGYRRARKAALLIEHHIAAMRSEGAIGGDRQVLVKVRSRALFCSVLIGLTVIATTTVKYYLF